MSLSLSKFLLESKISTSYLLISANEDCLPLANNLNLIYFKQLSQNHLRHVFQCDRYFNFSSVHEIIESNSLFGDKNYIELNFKTKPTLEHQKHIISLLPKLNEDNFLIIICDKLDKKDLSSEWLKSWQKCGEILLIQGDEKEAAIWCNYLFTQANLSIATSALELLVSMNQNNFAQLFQETQKLIWLFNAPYHITMQDAQTNLVENAQYNIFALSNAYLCGNTILCQKIFQNVCHATEDAILIVWNLAEDLRKLIQIKGSLKHDNNFANAINDLRVWGNSVQAFESANSRLSYPKLLSYFDELSKIDCIIKGIEQGNVLSCLEKLLVNFCKGT